MVLLGGSNVMIKSDLALDVTFVLFQKCQLFKDALIVVIQNLTGFVQVRIVVLGGKQFLQFFEGHPSILKAANRPQAVEMLLRVCPSPFDPRNVIKQPQVFVVAQGGRRQVIHFRYFGDRISFHGCGFQIVDLPSRNKFTSSILEVLHLS